MNTISLPLSGDLNRTKVKTSQTIYMHHRLLQLTVQEAHSYISEHSPGVFIDTFLITSLLLCQWLNLLKSDLKRTPCRDVANVFSLSEIDNCPVAIAPIPWATIRYIVAILSLV